MVKRRQLEEWKADPDTECVVDGDQLVVQIPGGVSEVCSASMATEKERCEKRAAKGGHGIPYLQCLMFAGVGVLPASANHCAVRAKKAAIIMRINAALKPFDYSGRLGIHIGEDMLTVLLQSQHQNHPRRK
jgi:hypothetical protein